MTSIQQLLTLFTSNSKATNSPAASPMAASGDKTEWSQLAKSGPTDEFVLSKFVNDPNGSNQYLV
jgi:hypothetical protein